MEYNNAAQGIRIIQDVLGHSKLEVTLNCTHVARFGERVRSPLDAILSV